MSRKTLISVLAALSLHMLATLTASADPALDFYRGKTITLFVGAEAGGGFDLYARALAGTLGRHIPGNPAFLVANMPGAGGMILGNYLAKTAPRDGTAIGVVSPLVLFEPVFAGAQSVAQFRGSDLTMIGNGATAHWALLARRSTDVASVNDLRHKELVVGAMARTGAGYILTHAMKEALALGRLKIVTGYAGIREIIGAVNRGEVSGCVMDLEDVMAIEPRWLSDGAMTVIALLSSRDTAETAPLAQAPYVMDFAMSEDDKQILNMVLTSTMLSRPLIGPPDIPAAQTKLLRQGFLATLADAGFLADAARLRIRPQPTSGVQMQDIVGKAYQLPPRILTRARSVLGE